MIDRIFSGTTSMPSASFVMQKITDKISALPKDGNYFSLEFFPPKTQMVCVLICMLHSLLTVFAGLLEPAAAIGTHVPCSTTAFRNRHLGSWRQHLGWIAPARRVMSTPAGPYNMPTPDVYQYEEAANRQGIDGSKSDGCPEHFGLER